MTILALDFGGTQVKSALVSERFAIEKSLPTQSSPQTLEQAIDVIDQIVHEWTQRRLSCLNYCQDRLQLVVTMRVIPASQITDDSTVVVLGLNQIQYSYEEFPSPSLESDMTVSTYQSLASLPLFQISASRVDAYARSFSNNSSSRHSSFMAFF